ncbi:uncharacterized protein LOC124143253 [Haliotis rufescens]|uniref:uncharacterized protein LOC124143253 n=1 Tax=Haliotis rufescens TaxID=6454 RepID=UPI00201F69BF|nr:uncharacterized protein LOC124143253 [Haliotis rufescens]
MAKECLDDASFTNLLASINQETNGAQNKLKKLYSSRGYFSSAQAATVLYALACPADKVKAIQILEPRLCRMTCKDSRDIIGAVSVHNDKLIVLNCVKRVLTDYQTRLGEEYILSAFPFEHDKHQALQILQTVRSDVADKVPAGGHQGYAALGGLYTQSRPLVPHLYGGLLHQTLSMAGQGQIEIPVTAKTNSMASMYSNHPSYMYPKDKSYAETRGYPGHVGFPATIDSVPAYPGGAPPLGRHSGAPAPTGFPSLDASGFAY